MNLIIKTILYIIAILGIACISITLWEAFIIIPEGKLHWDITYSCLEELYNITIIR